MVKAHREVFARLGLDAPNAVVLDTPYGFQTNADIVSDKAVAYFRESVGRRVSVAGLRRTRHRRARRARARPGPRRRGRLAVHGTRQPLVRAAPVAGDAGPRRAGPEAHRAGRARVLERGRADARHRHRARLRDLQGRRRSVLAGGARPAVPLRAAGRRHPALRQHRGRQPRHPLLLPRARTARAARAGAAARRVRARRRRAHGARDRSRRRRRDHPRPRRCHVAPRRPAPGAGRGGPDRAPGRPASGRRTTSPCPSRPSRRRRPSGPPEDDTQETASVAEVARRAAAAFDAAIGAGDADRGAGRRARARRRHRRRGRPTPSSRTRWTGPGPP